MQAMPALFLTSLTLFPGQPGERSREPDIALLREMLQDDRHVRGQAHAALLLVQSTVPEAESLVHEGLRNHAAVDTFLALATAIRTNQDSRFTGDLLAALVVNRPTIRQAAAEALAVL